MTKHFGHALLGVAMLAAWAGITVTPASAGTLIYAQNPDYNGTYASQNDTNGLGNFATAYDNFTLGAANNITSVEWVGSYYSPPTQGTITGFTVNFYANTAGAPGVLLYSTGDLAGNASETFLQNDNLGDPTYLYTLNTAGLYDFVAVANGIASRPIRVRVH